MKQSSVLKVASFPLLALVCSVLSAQQPPLQGTGTLPPPVALTTQQDHQRTMELLQITSLRRGADGRNAEAPNAANYDESRANPFPKLPDPLVLKNGKKVTSAKNWWNRRRAEIVAGQSEYHWMAGNYMKYAGPLTWNDLPVDSHELVALCAPRPVFISAGATKGDGWVDAKGMFLAGAGAGPVHRLLGKKDLGTTEFPAIETSLIDGDIAFRQHSGGHTPGPNWPTFLTFASRYLKGPPLRAGQPAEK